MKDIKYTLKNILAKELEIDNDLFKDDKLLMSLFKTSLKGTSEENDIATTVSCMPPSFWVALNCILAIEDEFNIKITDEEADTLYSETSKIIDLISLIKKKLET